MQLVTADFETYFAQDYTLKKLTTEAYVRDPRFKAHMLGTKLGSQPSRVMDGGVVADQKPFLERSAVICQKAQFDGLILAHHYGIRPAFWFDTLSMARLVFPHQRHHSLEALAELLGLPKKTVPYDSFQGVRDLPLDLWHRVAEGCKNDCDLTYQVFVKLLPHVPKAELELIDLTIRMFTEPCLELDRPKMEEFHRLMLHEKQNLLDQLGVTRKQLGSDAVFAKILRHVGVEPALKVTPKGNQKYAFAKTDDFMRDLEDSESPLVQKLVEARIDAKSTGTETRAQRMLDMNARGAMSVYLNYCGAHTTRWSGGDKMNWQNFKRDSEIRLGIVAPAGYVIAVGDLSQIECRMLNYMAGQTDVLEKFRQEVDLYSELASMFYGFPVTKKSNPTERGTGKQLELSCGYGAGAETIVKTAKLGIYGPPVQLTLEQGKAARDLYRSTHTFVVQLWREADQVLLALLNKQDYNWRNLMHARGGRLYGPNGTYLDYTTLSYDTDEREYRLVTKRGRVKMYGAKLVENVIQYLARIVIAEAMIKLKARHRIVMSTHDEVACLVPTEQATEAMTDILDTLCEVPAWCAGLPMAAEGGFDVRYSK